MAGDALLRFASGDSCPLDFFLSKEVRRAALFHEQHLPRFNKRSGPQLIEIHTACDIVCVPPNRLVPWFLSLIHEACNFSTQYVEHRKPDMALGSDMIVYCCRWVEGVRIVLLKGKTCRW